MPEIRSKSTNIQRALQRSGAPAIAPLQLAGKWVAWNWDRTKILAHGNTMDEADSAAQATGEKFVLQKLTRPEVIFIGAA